ncbi:MAG: DUF502 domain-containing protein [Candidatus Wallbacteria bacterium]|nr:DUF502 domain-containing protein [Candidatus Wallbacteria bacterium]
MNRITVSLFQKPGFKRFWRILRIYFFSGLAFLLPFAVTIYIFLYLFNWADESLLGDLLTRMFHYRIPGLGIILTMFLIILVGYLFQKAGIGLYEHLETFFRRLPMGNFLISTTNELSVFFTKSNKIVRNVVLVRYYDCEHYVIGLEMADAHCEMREKSGDDLVSVFIATTPNPITGWYDTFPRKQTIPVQITFEDYVKLVLSGGITMQDKMPRQL